MQYLLNGMFGRACKSLGNATALGVLAAEVGDCAGRSPTSWQVGALPTAAVLFASRESLRLSLLWSMLAGKQLCR